MKRLFLLGGLLLAACSSNTGTDPSLPTTIQGDGELAGSPSESNGEGVPMAAAGSSASDATGAKSASGGGNGTIQPGTLTAGVWDDNKNFDVFGPFRDAQAVADGAPAFTTAEQTAAHDLATGGSSGKQRLDIQIVIDTTGSMGDEIKYLDTEFDAITKEIQAKYPNAQQRWSLVAYKDKHDPYVVRWFDFRSDLTELHSKLSTLEASGGDDFPESPERALDVGTRLSWRSDGDVAKMIFWVADAPHHAEDGAAMTAAIRSARDKGVHIYPVAASGIDSFTEYTMRSAAQVTGGRYVFLTDDSGVGGSHEVPSVPCFFVTKLNDAIYRMVDVELTGQYREPTSSELIRTGGDPKNGSCQIENHTYTVY